ncbi:MAG: hypothetical protein AMXMBFR64_56060 [Myxococcales bacterium]
MTRRRLALLLAALLLASSGCERIRAALEERQELTAEQRAIQAYSDATPAVNQAQGRFVQVWELAVKNEQVEPLRAAIEKDVDPALDAYVEALRGMPATTPDLARIHGLLVSAYSKLQADVKVFREALSEENRKEPVDALIAQLDELTKAEDTYRRELKSYYEKHNITLITEKGVENDPAKGAEGAEGPATGAKRTAPAGGTPDKPAAGAPDKATAGTPDEPANAPEPSKAIPEPGPGDIPPAVDPAEPASDASP